MAEETGQERTLPPSERRLADARREGQVPRSRDLAHLLLLGGAGAVLFALATPIVAASLRVMAAGLTFDAASLADPARSSARLGELTLAALSAFAPVLVVLMIAAIAAPLAIGGWLFVPALAEPKFERLNPLSGLQRMVSLPALVELGKVVLIALLLAGVGGAYVVMHLDAFAQMAHEGLPEAVAHFGWTLAAGFAALAATLFVTSVIDVPWQIFRHHRNLRMTLEEVRRESRETEGDPQIRARVRSAQREMARKRMMAAIPTADVVVTNPTHFAVALKYLENRRGAPRVVAKGADEIAHRIREAARAHGVPQLEAPPLARALYRHVEVGAEIPAALYGAVAQVLAYVFQLRKFAAGQGPRPVDPMGIEIPEEWDPKPVEPTP